MHDAKDAKEEVQQKKVRDLQEEVQQKKVEDLPNQSPLLSRTNQFKGSHHGSNNWMFTADDGRSGYIQPGFVAAY